MGSLSGDSRSYTGKSQVFGDFPVAPDDDVGMMNIRSRKSQVSFEAIIGVNNEI